MSIPVPRFLVIAWRQLNKVFTVVLGLGAIAYLVAAPKDGFELGRVVLRGGLALFAAVALWRRLKAAVDDGPVVLGSALFELRAVYADNALAARPPTALEGNPYLAISDAELVGVAHTINPSKAPERASQLLDAIKHRVERAFVSDGRLLPAALRALEPTAAPAGAMCPTHPTEPAAICCHRCGGFLCLDCARFGRTHCRPCLELAVSAG